MPGKNDIQHSGETLPSLKQGVESYKGALDQLVTLIEEDKATSTEQKEKHLQNLGSQVATLRGALGRLESDSIDPPDQNTVPTIAAVLLVSLEMIERTMPHVQKTFGTGKDAEFSSVTGRFAEAREMITAALPQPALSSEPPQPHFTISPELSPAQQAYFGKLNEVLDTLGADAKEFDDRFRFATYLQGQHIATVVEEAISNHMFQKITGGHRVSTKGKLSDILGTRASIQDIYRHVPEPKVSEITGPVVPSDALQKKSGAAALFDPQQVIDNNKPILNYAGNYVQSQLFFDNDAHLGSTGVQLSNPSALEVKTLASRDRLLEELEALSQQFPIKSASDIRDAYRGEPVPADENVLASYAAGQRKMEELPTNERGIDIVIAGPPKMNVAKVRAASVEAFFKTSIYNTAKALERIHDLPEASREKLATQLQELDELFPKARLSPEIYAEKQAAEEAEKERREQREKVRAQEKEAAQKAAEEAKKAAEEAKKLKPEPYELLEGNKAGRIQNRAPEMAKEIETLRKAINRKDPVQNAVGDAMFADAVMLAGQYLAGVHNNIGSEKAFGKSPLKKDWRDAKPGVQAALIKLVNEQDTDKAHKEHRAGVVDTLKESPMLLIVGAASEKQLHAGRELVEKLYDPEHKVKDKAGREQLEYDLRKLAEDSLGNIGIHWDIAGEPPVVPQKPKPEATTPPVTPPAPPVQEPVIQPEVIAAAPEIVAEIPAPPKPIAAKPVIVPSTALPAKAPVDPRVSELLEAAKPFLANSKQGYTQFKSSLELNNNRHPINLALANSKHEAVTHTLLTNEPDLAKAVELKKAVQSYILNQEGIEPYRQPPHHGHTTLLMDHFIPNVEPDRVSLTHSSGIYRVDMSFTDANGPVDVSFSIGLKFDPANEAAAEARMGVLVDYLAEERKKSQQSEYEGRITKGEALETLKELAKGEQWDVVKGQPLEGYEERRELPHGMELAPARLHYEEGPNPTWILSFGVDLGEQSGTVHRTPRLHTAEYETAVSRSWEILDVAEGHMQRLAPSDVEEAKVRAALVDLPNYAKDLQIQAFELQGDNGNTLVVMEVIRGGRISSPEGVADQKPAPMKDTEFAPMQGLVVIEQADSAQVQELVAQAQAAFHSYIDDRYSARIEDGNDKAVERFHTNAARKALQDAMASAVEQTAGARIATVADKIVFGVESSGPRAGMERP